MNPNFQKEENDGDYLYEDIQFDPKLLEVANQIKKELKISPDEKVDSKRRLNGQAQKVAKWIPILLFFACLPFAFSMLRRPTEIAQPKFDLTTWVLNDTSFELREYEPMFLKDISAIRSNADGKWIAYGDRSGHLRVVDESLQKEKALPGWSAGITHIAWSKDSTKIAAGADDGAVIVFDRTTGIQSQFQLQNQPVRSLDFDRDGSTVSVIDRYNVSLLDLKSGSFKTNQFFSAYNTGHAFSHCGNKIVYNGTDGIAGVHWGHNRILIYDVPSESWFELENISTSNQRIAKFHWSDDDCNVIGLATDGKIYRWNIETRTRECIQPEKLRESNQTRGIALHWKNEDHYTIFVDGNIYQKQKSGLEKTGFIEIENDGKHPFSVDISACLLYTSPSPRDRQKSRMPSSA